MGEDIGSINWDSIAEWMKKNYEELQTAEPVDTGSQNAVASGIFDLLGANVNYPELESAEKKARERADWLKTAFTQTVDEKRTADQQAAFKDKFPSAYATQNPNPHSDSGGAIPIAEEVSEDSVKDDDYLNQLMMAALMAGGKKGKMGQLGGAAGGGISFGDPWTMNAPWEKDYRYLS